MNVRKNRIAAASLAVCLAFLWFAVPSARNAGLHEDSKEARKMHRALVLDGSNVHNVGELQMHITNWGLFGSYPGSTYPFSWAPSAQWPAGSGVEYLFGAGIWVGAIKGGVPHVTTSMREFELRPTDDPVDIIYRSKEGSLGGKRIPMPGADDDRDGQIDEDWLNGRDDDMDGRIDEDYAAISDQMFSCWYTDDQPVVQELYPRHDPLPIMIRQESYQWADDRFDDFVGIHFRITNTGTEVLENVYAGLYVDPDVGPRDSANYWEDDAAGYLPPETVSTDLGPAEVQLGYCYDADGDGGRTPGYIGAMILGHPTDPAGIDAPEHAGIATYACIDNSDGLGGLWDPSDDFMRYEILSWETIDRNKTIPRDYKMVVGTGRFARLEPGETLDFEVAFVMGEGLEGLKQNAANARILYEGTWYDVDGDPNTGVDGKETQVHWLLGYDANVVQAALDIKPGSCENPFNTKVFDKDPGNNDGSMKGGVLPVALLGDEDFDVTMVDIATVGLGGAAPLRYQFQDIAAPSHDKEMCPCPTQGPDGYMDMVLKFKKSDVARVLGTVRDGDRIPLTLSGRLMDGTEFAARDCIRIIGKSQGPRKETSVRGNEVTLGPAVPNPFNPVTRIQYYLPREMRVGLSVFDVNGTLVERLVDDVQSPGDHTIEWNAEGKASGVYFYRLTAGDAVQVKRMILLK